MHLHLHFNAGSDVGDCATDTFSITSPGGVGSPVICGYNTGQHSETLLTWFVPSIDRHCTAISVSVVMDASSVCHKATFALGSTSTQRSWDILVTQYECGDTNAGPSNCLQYFVGASGTVAR